MNDDIKDTETFREKLKNIIVCIKSFCIFNSGEPTAFNKYRYRQLQVKLFLFIAVLSLIPLILVSTSSYFWLQNTLSEDFNNQLRSQLEGVKNSLEFFLDVKLSALRFIASSYNQDELLNHEKMKDIYTNLKKEFEDIIDFGVINSNGIMESYVGPYNLAGTDFSKQFWFNNVIVNGFYVSSIYSGYRNVPHFIIVVRKDLPEKGTFLIIRAAVNVKTLNSILSPITLKQEDDAFLIDYNGIIQTPSRFHGKLLDEYKMQPPPRQNLVTLESRKEDGERYIHGYVYIKNAPWILNAIIKSLEKRSLATISSGEILLIIFGSVFVVFIVSIRMSQILINRIKKSDRLREEALKEIEHTNKLASIGRLAAGVAHEINNPLSIISQKAGLMKDFIDMSSDMETNKELIENLFTKDKFIELTNGITSAVDRCRTITHRLLGFARRMSVSIEELNINELVKEVLIFTEKEISRRNVQIELDFYEKLPKIKSDKGLLQQVILNIITNAADAVDDNGLIMIKTYKEEAGSIWIAIKDDGHGIPKSQIKHIFEPFFTTKGKDKGTGLGLSISYGIIKKLGGTLSVQSEVNKGTTFYINLPVEANIEI
ncbi:MAG: ATP-binding protein [Nitrospirae bacterium]|nr:ATP-binding protein [Nitrospirota bacterium]